MRISFLIFPEIAKLNKREMIQKLSIREINTFKVLDNLSMNYFRKP